MRANRQKSSVFGKFGNEKTNFDGNCIARFFPLVVISHMPRLHLCYKKSSVFRLFFPGNPFRTLKILVPGVRLLQEKNNYAAKASLIITQQPKTTAAESRNFRWATHSYYFLDNNFHDDCMALSESFGT